MRSLWTILDHHRVCVGQVPWNTATVVSLLLLLLLCLSVCLYLPERQEQALWQWETTTSKTDRHGY